MTCCLVLHLYYKLTYIKLACSGEEEKETECAAGNLNAKNWQDEACQVVEWAVSSQPLAWEWCWPTTQMEKKQLHAAMTHTASTTKTSFLLEYDWHQHTLLACKEEGWATELQHYLKWYAGRCYKGDEHCRMVGGMWFCITCPLCLVDGWQLEQLHGLSHPHTESSTFSCVMPHWSHVNAFSLPVKRWQLITMHIWGQNNLKSCK